MPVSYGMTCSYAERVMTFFNEIGLPASVRVGASGFTKHIEIVEGAIEADPSAPASSLLHEAGHLAIVPGQFRQLLSGDLGEGMKKIFAVMDEMDLDPDDPLSRAMLQAGDTEATAWAWAAGTYLALPEEVIVADEDYDGEGASIRLMLRMNSYFGINGLSNAGFCKTNPRLSTPLPVYPELVRWMA